MNPAIKYLKDHWFLLVPLWASIVWIGKLEYTAAQTETLVADNKVKTEQITRMDERQKTVIRNQEKAALDREEIKRLLIQLMTRPAPPQPPAIDHGQ